MGESLIIIVGCSHWLRQFGRVCLQIPKLKSAELFTTMPEFVEIGIGVSLEGKSPWGVWYFSPETSPDADKRNMDHIHRRRVFWDVRDWSPDVNLRGLLRIIGCERHGTPFVERFIDTWGTVRKKLLCGVMGECKWITRFSSVLLVHPLIYTIENLC